MEGILVGIAVILFGVSLELHRIGTFLKETNRLKKIELKRLGISEKEIEGK